MPRPGPRPYECMRRAWHSDSHQPLRGTLIQEIFRVVNELHSTSTRRKKEWQEKLPIVVLRAEEILYSKANSEGEYADVETLSSRLNDAVNTMIQREDSEEEGIYLVPCVEAALSIGCTPKRGSRGQRRGGARHLPNLARRGSPVARSVANEDSIAGMTSTDPVRTSHERQSSSTFSLMGAQVLSMQEQDFHSIPHVTASSLISPAAGAFWGPSPCYPPNASFTPPQNPSFHNSLDVCLPVSPSHFQTPGSLVQFLRATKACKYSGFPGPRALYVSPQIGFNPNKELGPLRFLDSAESSGARMSSRLLCGDVVVRSCGSPTPCPISRLPKDVSSDDYIGADPQNKLSLGVAAASSLDSASRTVVQNGPPSSFDMGLNSELKEFSSLPTSVHATFMPKAVMSFLPNWCKGDKTASSQRNSSGALSGIGDNSASLSGVHDLQLRLGPPVDGPSTAPDSTESTVDTSAPKRMRVDVLDPSGIQIE